jgi:hypothetical protein
VGGGPGRESRTRFQIDKRGKVGLLPGRVRYIER